MKKFISLKYDKSTGELGIKVRLVSDLAPNHRDVIIDNYAYYLVLDVFCGYVSKERFYATVIEDRKAEA